MLRRLKLIEEDLLINMIRELKESVPEGPQDTKLAAGERAKMNDILATTSSDDSSRAYNEAHANYEQFTRNASHQPQQQQQQQQQQQRSETEDIIDNTPKQKVSKVRLLLSSIDPDKIRWSRNKELIIDGRTIEGSNVHDLIRAVTGHTAKIPTLTGFDEFITALRQTNVPVSVAGNERRASLLRKVAQRATTTTSQRSSAIKRWEK